MPQSNPNISWHDDDGFHNEPEVDYHKQWNAYALRRNVALFLLYAWPFVAAALLWYSRHYLHLPLVTGAAIGLWLALALTAVWWAGEFRCPRCRRRYGALGHRHGTNMTRGIFDTVCSNCKLRKFEHG